MHAGSMDDGVGSYTGTKPALLGYGIYGIDTAAMQDGCWHRCCPSAKQVCKYRNTVPKKNRRSVHMLYLYCNCKAQSFKYQALRLRKAHGLSHLHKIIHNYR